MVNPHISFGKFLGPAKTYWNNLKSLELITVGATALVALSALASMGITLPIVGPVQAALPKLPALGSSAYRGPDYAMF